MCKSGILSIIISVINALTTIYMIYGIFTNSWFSLDFGNYTQSIDVGLFKSCYEGKCEYLENKSSN